MTTVSVLVLDWNDFGVWRGVSLPGRQMARYRTLTKVTLRLLDTASRAVREFRPVTRGKASPPPPRLPISFSATMDDDLSVPAALAAVHATVRDGNYALSRGDQENAVTSARRRGPCSRSSVSTRSPRPGGRAILPAACPGAVDALVALALSQRELARARGRLCFGELHRGHPGEHRDSSRGHAGRPSMGAGAMSAPDMMNVMNWRNRL
jgi:hypothetical protein